MKPENIKSAIDTTKELTGLFIRLGQGVTGYVKEKVSDAMSDTTKKVENTLSEAVNVSHQVVMLAGATAIAYIYSLCCLTDGIKKVGDLIDLNDILKDQKDEECEAIHFDFERMSHQYDALNGEKQD